MMAQTVSNNINTTTSSKRTYIDKDRVDGHEHFMEVLYDADMFKNRFLIRRELFLLILDEIHEHDPFFRLSWDDRGKRSSGLSACYKCTSTIHQLAYEAISDAHYEYLKMLARVSHECLDLLILYR
jgi:hypothetical protein